MPVDSTPLGMHLGNGVLLIMFGSSFFPDAVKYEVQIAEQEVGPYYAYQNSVQHSNLVYVYNLPCTGISIFARIRGIEDDGTTSVWQQVARGAFDPAPVTMNCLGPAGWIIPDGAKVGMRLSDSPRLAIFESTEQIEF